MPKYDHRYQGTLHIRMCLFLNLNGIYFLRTLVFTVLINMLLFVRRFTTQKKQFINYFLDTDLPTVFSLPEYSRICYVQVCMDTYIMNWETVLFSCKYTKRMVLWCTRVCIYAHVYVCVFMCTCVYVCVRL